MKLTLGFSPCPNDTFIFEALVNRKIDTEDFEFDVVLDDVQALNNMALEGRLDITKVSYGVLPLILEKYIVLNSGSALGKGVGPLLISKEYFENEKSKIENLHVAIPGENTTAHLLFNMAFPNARKKTFLVFNEIEDAVLAGKVDAGVIIHENRFTYAEKGLNKIVDLGEFWEQKMKLPIPLGGIVIKRALGTDVQRKVDGLIKRSLEYAFKQYPHLTQYVTQHAQEMSEDVMRKHIDLYVNDYSLDLKTEGKEAITTLLNIFDYNTNDVFVVSHTT